jgi:replicative DNA helicase
MKYLLYAFLILAALPAQAQRTCGTTDYLRERLATDPGLQSRIDLMNDRIRQKVEQKSGGVQRDIIRIPVVVHVVYKLNPENISDAQIQSQIDVLNEDYRHPIPMGIPGIDRLLKGGLAKGELGVILAPTGVGKSTFLTKIANHSFNLGYNVLQIFFEDNPKIIQRKHITLWTKVHPDELSNKKDEVMDKVREVQSKMENRLILKKLPSDTLTMLQIKNQLRKMIADGIKLDMIVLDYIDCIVPDKNLGDEWKSEGSVMRGFEAMCHELNLVGWTATQGNRSSISSEVVTTDQMGGSIKKAQVGHVIISVAKTLQQKEMKLATIAITKSRIGDDGIVFENCKFDNGMLEIDTESSVTFLGLEEQKEEQQRQRVKDLLERRKQREQQNN